MICRDVLEFLMSYLNGELPADQVTAFEEHLSLCPSCVNYLNSYQQTVTLGRSVAESDTEVALPEELVQAVLASQRDAVP
jgi:anti-sigma factor RsiW